MHGFYDVHFTEISPRDAYSGEVQRPQGTDPGEVGAPGAPGAPERAQSLMFHDEFEVVPGLVNIQKAIENGNL